MTIEPYIDADYPEVWALHLKTIAENDGFAKNLSFHSDFQNIPKIYDAFFVLRVDDVLAGMVAFKPDGEIKRLQVASACQGRGYGHMLMERVIDHAKARGMKRVHLDVSAPNRAAFALYLKMGFVITRTDRIEYGPDHEAFDMTFMELAIS
ncbi:MAG: GNAT family N-acetyltransferase [Alphaproteobacteria bacterium]|nr:GNAT family N-acetyltransferase [Alphaproteobacteria bacterium]